MFFKFSDEAQKLLLLSLKEKNKLSDEYIGSEHVFLAALSMTNTRICQLLNESDVTYDKFFSFFNKKKNKKVSNYYVFTPLMNEIFDDLSTSHNHKNGEILMADIIIEILSRSNSKTVLILKKLDIDIRKLLKTLNVSNKKKNIKKGILNELGINLNEKFVNSQEIVLERNDELNMIVEILCCKNKNNPLLIGDAGVGKTAIVEELARKINDGDVPYQLKNKKIYSVAMSSLVAGTKYRGEFEDKVNKLVAEVENDEDIILFIDEIHTLVGAGGADGAIDASNILKPYLARGSLKIIGATTKEEYKKYFSSDKALSRRFQVVTVEEPNAEKTKKILMGIKSIYEEYHNVIISDDIIDKIIYYADKYIKNRKFPDKAIDILDEVAVLSSIFYNREYHSMINLDKEIKKIISLKNRSLIDGNYRDAIKYSHDEKHLQNKMGRFQKNFINGHRPVNVTEEILLKVMERKTNILFYTYNCQYEKIDNLLKKYKNNSIFPDSIIDRVIDFTINTYGNLINTCISNSLFIRSNKHGLNNYFIDEYVKIFFESSQIIRIDVNNFRNIDDLIRDNDVINKNDNFIDKIKNNPFSIVIIDNLNDADYSIKDFFNKIDHYGYYIDRDNEKIDFSNVLFIYNILVNNSIGFNDRKQDNNNRYCLDIDMVDSKKLKRKIKRIGSDNNCHLTDKSTLTILDKVISDLDNLNSLEFFIRREINHFDVNKGKTIQV